MIRNIPARICTAEMVPVPDQYLFGLCFSKYFTPGYILGWTNLLGYHSLAIPDYATGIRSVYWYLRSAQPDNQGWQYGTVRSEFAYYVPRTTYYYYVP